MSKLLTAFLVTSLCLQFSCVKPVDPVEQQRLDTLQSRLVQAVKLGAIHAVTDLLDQGADVNGGEDLSSRPLFVAIRRGHTDIAMLLLDRGADPALCDPRKTNALMFACWKGNLAVATRCVNAGVPINATNDSGEAPLLFASSFCSEDIVRMLLARGANPVARDPEGMTALHWAAFRGCPDVMPALLEAAPQLLNRQDKTGRTPLMMAVIAGEVTAVQQLLELGADSGIGDDHGRTAHDWAKQTENSEITDLLSSR